MLSDRFLNIFACAFNFIYFLVCLPLISCLFSMGDAVFNLILPVCLIFLLPLIFFVYVYFEKNRRNIPKFFFGIEMPVLILSILRICLLRELTPFYLILLLSMVFTIILFSLNLFERAKENKILNKISVFVYEMPVIFGSYFLILSLFFIVPLVFKIIKFAFSREFFELIANIGKEILDAIIHPDAAVFIGVIYCILILIFLAALLLIFIITPIVSIVIYVREFVLKYKEFNSKKQCAVFAAFYVLILLISSCHISGLNFDKEFNNLKQAGNYSEIVKLANNPVKQFIMKRAYLDGYLASQRYVIDNKSNVIKELWKDSFRNEKFSVFMQHLFNRVAYPFYYDGEFKNNTVNEKFVEFFDEDIQFALKNKIKKSIDSTFFNKQETATLLDIDSKDVLIKSRKIKIDKTKTKDIYKVTFVDEFKNNTKSEKEVYYDFSLPKNAVITALKLGDKLQYQGLLSPKGAARKTYLAQTVKRKDPALLEKNGVIQYTLRVYPIPSRLSLQNQKVSFEYYIYSKDGSIALPLIYQTRNGYLGINSENKVEFQGKKLKVKNNCVNIENLRKEKVILPENQNIAILMDTSYSIKINWNNYIKNELSELINKNRIDYYFFNKFLSEKMDDIEKVKQINFSKSARYDAYCSLENKYDSVILLTDSSVFDASSYRDCKNNMPLYVFHISHDDKIPPYDNDFTNLIYRTKGNIGSNIEQVFGLYLADSYVNTDEFFVFALQKEIDRLLKQENPDKEKIFLLAKKGNIVTNYSSLISLVNDIQKEELKKNEQNEDKFDADLDIGKEDFEEKNVETVPEPRDYLFILVMILLSIIFYKKNSLKCLK